MSDKSTFFSIIIINWNGAKWLPRCLDALRAQSFKDFEIILVDNDSTDNSLQIIEEHHPEIRVLKLDKNTGFAAGNNHGAEIAQGEWLVLLNNDAFALSDWLEKLHLAINKYPDFAGFGSCLLNAETPTTIDGLEDVYHCSGYAYRLGNNQPLSSYRNTSREIFGPCGAAAIYRTDAFHDSGGFDEDYFCYFEDVDLAFRMRLYGYRFRSVPNAVVHHIGSASVGRLSYFSRYHGHRNLVWTFVKNMPGWLLFLFLPIHITLNLYSLIAISFNGQPGAIWRAKYDALLGLPRAWEKRKRIQARRSITTTALMRWLSCDLQTHRKNSS